MKQKNIHCSTTQTTGTRYRYIESDNDTRYKTIEGYTQTQSRYTGTRTPLYGNGQAVATNRSASQHNNGRAYFGTDILGSVRSATNEYSTLEDRYEYDIFGTPYEGNFSAGLSNGYTGKPYDTVTGLYNYGYRDYSPQVARFTTVDPIRDGNNWFSYVVNDPVNYVDLWGLSASDANQGSVWDNYTGAGNPYETTPTTFLQRSFTEEFSETFAANACAGTSLLNELSERYTIQTGRQLTVAQGNAAMQAAVDDGGVNVGNAHVDNWESAANGMWESMHPSGGSFTYGGENPQHTIYAIQRNTTPLPEHFVNSNGPETYFDPSSGTTGQVDSLTLTNNGDSGPTRNLTYNP